MALVLQRAESLGRGQGQPQGHAPEHDLHEPSLRAAATRSNFRGDGPRPPPGTAPQTSSLPHSASNPGPTL
jgi:hypothetical protein